MISMQWFTVREGENLPNYLIIWNNVLHPYGIELHVGKEYLKIEKNEKKKTFQVE